MERTIRVVNTFLTTTQRWYHKLVKYQYFIQLCRALAVEGRFEVTVLCSLLRFIEALELVNTRNTKKLSLA